MDKATWVLVWVTGGLVIANIVLAIATAWYASTTRKMLDEIKAARQAEGPLLAGALAAELRGFLQLWTDVRRSLDEHTGETQERIRRGECYVKTPLRWTVQMPCTPVFDAAAARICLLGPALALEAVKCYERVKRAASAIVHAQTSCASAEAAPDVTTKQHASRSSAQATGHALRIGEEAASVVSGILERLEKLAGKG